MKFMNTLAAIILPLTIAGACTSYSAIAQAPENKVFVTKTTSYIIWTSNKMLLCDYAAGTASNCTEVTQN